MKIGVNPKLALGEAYMDGQWDCEALDGLTLGRVGHAPDDRAPIGPRDDQGAVPLHREPRGGEPGGAGDLDEVQPGSKRDLVGARGRQR